MLTQADSCVADLRHLDMNTTPVARQWNVHVVQRVFRAKMPAHAQLVRRWSECTHRYEHPCHECMAWTYEHNGQKRKARLSNAHSAHGCLDDQIHPKSFLNTIAEVVMNFGMLISVCLSCEMNNNSKF